MERYVVSISLPRRNELASDKANKQVDLHLVVTNTRLAFLRCKSAEMMPLSNFFGYFVLH